MRDILKELGCRYSLEELEKRRVHFIADSILKKISEDEYNLLILLSLWGNTHSCKKGSLLTREFFCSFALSGRFSV